MHKIKKDDMVKIIAGKDKDKTGKVLSVDTKKNEVVVEGCNMVTLTEKLQELASKLKTVRKSALLRQPVK